LAAALIQIESPSDEFASNMVRTQLHGGPWAEGCGVTSGAAGLSDVDFRRLFDAAPTPLMVMDRDLRIVTANRAYLAVTRRRLSDIAGRYVFDAFPESEEHTAPFRRGFERALAGEASTVTTEPFAVPRPPEEGGGFQELVWTCAHTPVRDAAGQIAFVIQHAQDVTGEHNARRRTAMLTAELGHRIKNLLTSILGIARTSLKGDEPAHVAREAFMARIAALGASHDLLTEASWRGASVSEVVTRALTPFGGADDPRFVLDGPEVPLDPRQALALAMAIHELGSNAVKYGALSNEDGRVELRWRLEAEGGAPTASLSWSERGGPEVRPPGREGFGTNLLTKLLAGDLRGESRIDYAPEGVRFACRFAVGPEA
jgi:PAS domain S-box-containing protein